MANQNGNVISDEFPATPWANYFMSFPRATDEDEYHYAQRLVALSHGASLADLRITGIYSFDVQRCYMHVQRHYDACRKILTEK